MNQQQQQTNRSYSVREAADLLSLAPGTVRKYCRNYMNDSTPRITCYRLSNRYRITQDTIDDILSRKVEIK